ncbi:hypothetical protein FQZ97_888920 [compost metagenome]
MRLDASSNQGEAGLVIVLLARIDHGDAGALQAGRQLRGGGQAGRPRPRDHDAGAALDAGGMSRGAGLRQRRGQGQGAQTGQEASARGFNPRVGLLGLGHGCLL